MSLVQTQRLVAARMRAVLVALLVVTGCRGAPVENDGGNGGGAAGGTSDGGRGGGTAGGGSGGSGGGAPLSDAGLPSTPFGSWLPSQPAGTWVPYTASTGFATSLFESANMAQTRDTMGYSSVAAFDPVNGEVVFTGKGYGGGTEYLSTVWTLSTDRWAVRARGAAGSIFQGPGPEAYGHGYNGNAWDPTTGRYCFYAFQSQAVQCWNRAMGSFRTAFTLSGRSEYSHSTPVLVAFPEYGADGGMLFQAKSNTTLLLDYATGMYRDLGSPWSDRLHSIGGHNPFRREVMFGGGSDAENGSTGYWVVSVAGELSTERSWPVRSGVEKNSAVLHDPANGDWLLLDTPNRRLYRSSDGVTWTLDPQQLPVGPPVIYAVLPQYRCLIAIASGFADYNQLGLWVLRL